MKTSYTYSAYINQFRTAKKEAEEFILSLDKTTFLLRPNENSWCIAECYSHLNNFGRIYYNSMQEMFDHTGVKPVASKNIEQFSPRLHWKLAASFFEPPYRIKIKTFAPFKPDAISEFTKEGILNGFVELQESYIAQLEKAELQQLDINRLFIRNPIFSFLKMTFSECYSIVGAHQRRHQWQAEQVLDMLHKKNL